MALAFAGLLLMLFRDQIRDYGYGYRGMVDAEKVANAKGRRLARRFAPHVYRVGVPLVILGAGFEIVGNPNDKLVLQAREIPERVVFLPLDSKQMDIDLKKLDDALKTLDENSKIAFKNFGVLSYPEILVVNCGPEALCQCPPDFTRVRDIGGWNLNAGTQGDVMTLCSRSVRYDYEKEGASSQLEGKRSNVH